MEGTIFMISKKLRRAILSALVVGYVAAPPPVIQAASPVSSDPQQTDVESSESNEDILGYLELTDYFVTSAARIPTSRWDTPANVTVITSQEIEANHYQTVAEALSHVNGVLITNIGTTDTSGFVNINGSNRVLLLIDGHRANPSQDAYVGGGRYVGDMYKGRGLCELSMIPSIKMIDKIEIVKGGASALYGSDAVGGVVNVITKKGEIDQTTVDVNYGSWSRYNLEATNQGVKGKLSWFVTAGLGKSDEADFKASYIYYNASRYNDYKDRDISIRVDDTFSDRNSLTISYMHKSHDYAKYYQQQFGFDYYKMYNSSSIEYRFKEDTSTPGWFRYFNNYQKGYDSGTDYYFGDSKLQGLEYQNGWEIGDHHKLIAGVEWHRVEASSPENWYDEKVDTIASYLQDTISLGNKWTVVPGVRYDHTKDFGGNWAPKLAANYRPDDKTKVYASWGRTYSIPTIGEGYTFGYDYGSYYYPIWRMGGYYSGTENDNPMGLKPETGHSENIGIEHDFDDNTSASLNFFNNELKDVVSWSTYWWSYDFVGTDNNLKQKRRGLELTFKQNLSDRWSYDLGYSHTRVKNVYSGTYGDYEDDHFGQPNGYRLGVHYNVGKWRANLLGIMASGLNTSYYDDNYNTGYASKSYVVLDFNTSYDFTDRTSVYFRTLNFTDEEYSNDTRAMPAPGRFVQIGATYKF